MIGQNLKKCRLSKNLTQDRVADLLNIDRSTYTKYELDVVEPSLKTLKKLTTIFDVDYNYLLN